MDGCELPGDNNKSISGDKFKCDFQPSLVNRKLQEFYRNRKFCDVTLVADAGGVRIDAHRTVLAASSDYFYAMFGGSLSESSSEEVFMNQVDGVTLKAMVDFMYFATIEIRTDNVENILTAASLLNLNTVAKRGSEFMTSNLEPSNCLGITLFAEQYNFPLLLKYAYARVCEWFTELPEEEEFNMLSAEQLSRFLTCNDLSVDSEEDVFRVVIKWIEHDRENRNQYIAKLFELILFYKIPSKFIDSEVVPWCRANDALSVFEKAREKHCQSKSNRHRNPKKKLTYINVWLTDENVMSAEVYDPILNCWEYQEWPANKNRSRSVFNVAVLCNKLVMAGGRIEFFHSSNIVEAFDLKTLKYSELPQMLVARDMFALVALNGKLYAIGGRGNDGVLQSVERYDPDKRVWKFVAPTIEKHSEHAAVCLSGKIYVHDASQSFECYDPEMNLWSKKAPITSSTSQVAMAVVNDCLFAMTDGKLHRYDVENDMWSLISTLTDRRMKNIECCGYGDSIIISDGNSLVMAYNTLTDGWSTLPSLKGHFKRGVLITV